MTILFLSRLFYPHIGGVEKHVLEVGKRLIKKGHRVIVITEEISSKNKTSRLAPLNGTRSKNKIPVYQLKDTSAKVTGEVEGIKVYYITLGKEQRIHENRDSGLAPLRGTRQNNRGKKFRIWWELWKIMSLIKTADVIHCHDVFFWYLPFRFIYFNKPIFTTFHGYETKFPPSKKSILIRKISEKLSWGNICVGDYISRWYGTTPTFVTYGGVEIRNPKSEIRNKFKTQNSKIKIVFIGRLEEDTGITIYLKALDLLKTKNIQYEFEVYGDGSLRNKVEQYGNVYGFVKDLNQYIEKEDVVFASSYLSILEAMKQKKLVFAVYDNPLKEDYLKMSPFAKWIVIENSPKDVVDKVLYFTDHQDEKERMIDKGYEWVKTQTWEKMVDNYIKLWNSNDTYH